MPRKFGSFEISVGGQAIKIQMVVETLAARPLASYTVSSITKDKKKVTNLD